MEEQVACLRRLQVAYEEWTQRGETPVGWAMARSRATGTADGYGAGQDSRQAD